MSTESRLAIIIYGMVNAVLFGVGAIAILSFPSLDQQWKIWMPVVVVVSLVLAWPVARVIAPRMRARYWRERQDR